MNIKIIYLSCLKRVTILVQCEANRKYMNNWGDYIDLFSVTVVNTEFWYTCFNDNGIGEVVYQYIMLLG